MENIVTFKKEELELFDFDQLKLMLKIQINSEKYEGASIIRDEIERKKKILFGDPEQNDDLEIDE